MILTRQDLSDEENLRQCRHDYRVAFETLGAARPFKLAEWALNWGNALLESAKTAIDQEEEDDETKDARENFERAAKKATR